MATIGNINIGLFANHAAFNRSMGAAGRSVTMFRGTLTRLTSPVSNATRSLLALAGVGGTVAAAFKSIQTGSNFEQAMSGLKAVNLSTPAKEMEKMSEAALELSKTGTFGPTAVVGAMTALSKAGLPLKDVQSAIEPTLKLAQIGTMELGEAADMTFKIMSGMGIEASKAAHTIDVLAKAADASAADVRELGDAFKFAGPFGRIAGYNIEQVAASIMVMSNAGRVGEEAGTGIRQVIMALTSPGKAAKDSMDELGISIADMFGRVRPLANIVEQFQKKLAGKGSAERLEVLGTIFEARAAGAMATLIETGSEQLRSFERQLGQSAGYAAKTSKAMIDNMIGDWNRFKAALAGLAINFSNLLSPMIRKTIQQFTNMVNRLSEKIQQNIGPIKEFLARIWGGFVTGIKMAIFGVMNFKKIWAVIVTEVTYQFYRFTQVIKFFFTNQLPVYLSNVGKQIVNAFSDAAKDIAKSPIFDAVEKALRKIAAPPVSIAFENLRKQIAGNEFNKLPMDPIPERKAGGREDTLHGRANHALNKLVEAFNEFNLSFQAPITDFLKQFPDTAKQFGKNLFDRTALGQVINAAKPELGKLWENFIAPIAGTGKKKAAEADKTEEDVKEGMVQASDNPALIKGTSEAFSAAIKDNKIEDEIKKHTKDTAKNTKQLVVQGKKEPFRVVNRQIPVG